jgi:hypothetical protein
MADSPHPVPPLGFTFPSAPAPHRRLTIDLTAEPTLADLASLFGDLLVADMASHHINEPAIQAAGHLYLRRACWEGAIIAYGRCFGGGQGATRQTRLKLDEFLVHLDTDQLATHKRILHLRDKRIGHHVAQDSGQAVDFYVGVERPSATVLHLNNLFVHVETDLYDLDLLTRLQDITTILRAKVGERIDELRFSLLDDMARDLNGVTAAVKSDTSWTRPEDIAAG